MTRTVKFVTIGVTPPARQKINNAAAWLTGIARRRVPTSQATMAMLAVAERYPDEVMAELDKQTEAS